MKVTIDEDRCEGHGRCYDIAPALFEPDDVGQGVVVGDGVVPEDRHDLARRAAANCPERAITVEYSDRAP